MSSASRTRKGTASKIAVTLYISPWVPVYAQVKETVEETCRKFSDQDQVKVTLKVVDSEDPAAESSRIITVPSLIVAGFGYERILKGRQVIDRLETTLRQTAARARH